MIFPETKWSIPPVYFDFYILRILNWCYRGLTGMKSVDYVMLSIRNNLDFDELRI